MGSRGVFSGFLNHVNSSASKYGVDARDIFFELGKRKAVAGQESLIFEVARALSEKKINGGGRE